LMTKSRLYNDRI